MPTSPKARPMKEADLRQHHCECSRCHRKLGQTLSPCFYKLTVESHILNLPAIQRQQGLGMQLGGNGFLAMHMGEDEDMTVTPDDPPKTLLLCLECSSRSFPLSSLIES